MAEQKTIITLICERAAEVDSVMSGDSKLKDQPNVKVIKFPCSGMIQPLMVEKAINGGASGVVVCGCQIGDCYYREGNKMIRDRLLGSRPPGLKAKTDRRRVLALWLSRKQTDRFLSETKEFVDFVSDLDKEEPSKAAAKPTPKPAPAKKAEEPKKEVVKEEKASEDKPEDKSKDSDKSKSDDKPKAKDKDDKKD